MATMDDIARALGIAKSTVSKALSGAEDVGETTRKLVLEKAVELGYARSGWPCSSPTWRTSARRTSATT